jgi:hypothetical protein
VCVLAAAAAFVAARCFCALRCRACRAWHQPPLPEAALLTRASPCPATHPAGDERPGRVAADMVFVIDEKPHPRFK